MEFWFGDQHYGKAPKIIKRLLKNLLTNVYIAMYCTVLENFIEQLLIKESYKI